MTKIRIQVLAAEMGIARKNRTNSASRILGNVYRKLLHF